MLTDCFNVLKSRWKITNFMSKRDSALASKVLYQWSIYCKLKKIRDRYTGSENTITDQYEKSLKSIET